ncbi:MAG: hypothetical protein MdMp014T_0782 [Treponematales bacterium]
MSATPSAGGAAPATPPPSFHVSSVILRLDRRIHAGGDRGRRLPVPAPALYRPRYERSPATGNDGLPAPGEVLSRMREGRYTAARRAGFCPRRASNLNRVPGYKRPPVHRGNGPGPV